MTWFFFLLPLSLLYVATAYFNRWPSQSLWVLAIIAIGPVWMMIRELFPKSLSIVKTKFNLLFYFQKQIKAKDRSIELLKNEIRQLHKELNALHGMWLQTQSRNQNQIGIRPSTEKIISDLNRAHEFFDTQATEEKIQEIISDQKQISDFNESDFEADVSAVDANQYQYSDEFVKEQVTVQKIDHLFKSIANRNIDFETDEAVTENIQSEVSH